MRCSRRGCTGRLQVTHTYTVGTHKFQRAICSGCGKPYRVEVYAFLAEQRGDGARAHAARMKKGEPQQEAGQGSPG